MIVIDNPTSKQHPISETSAYFANTHETQILQRSDESLSLLPSKVTEQSLLDR